MITSPPLFDLAKHTTKLHKVLNEVASLERKTLNAYVKAGQLLIQIKSNLRHGEWLPWLRAEHISRAKAELYMKVAKDPGLYARAQFNLANVRTGKFSRLENFDEGGRDAVREAIFVARKLQGAISYLSPNDIDNVDLITELDKVLSVVQLFRGLCPKCKPSELAGEYPNRVCLTCKFAEHELVEEEIAEEQDRIKREESIGTLRGHPSYPWMRKLIIRAGDNYGELRADDKVRGKYGRGYDEIAQELGYERGTVPLVGRAPPHEMMPDERFKHDLQEAYKRALELGLLKRRNNGRYPLAVKPPRHGNVRQHRTRKASGHTKTRSGPARGDADCHQQSLFPLEDTTPSELWSSNPEASDTS